MKLATQFITWTYQQPYRPAKQKVTKKQKIALNGSADAYNEFIWSLARKFTNSAEEAEAAVKEMQADIQQCADQGVQVSTNEERLTSEIAWRRLKKFLM